MHHGITDSPWMKDSISINIDQIVEILFVLTSNHVASSVRVSEGIQEGLKTSLQKLNKRILCFVLATSTKYGVFQNMRDTGRIFWRSAQSNTKDFIVVIASDTQQFGTTLFVSVKRGRSTILLDEILSNNFISWVLHIHRLFDIRFLSDCGAHADINARTPKRGPGSKGRMSRRRQGAGPPRSSRPTSERSKRKGCHCTFAERHSKISHHGHGR
mmetsp:Transcript_113821/g.317900  ORF Transcript_113821/g.317900 Transcript_113821/m.317900 type:complete len:214 (-) Transcript_113821:154-795(-)